MNDTPPLQTVAVAAAVVAAAAAAVVAIEVVAREADVDVHYCYGRSRVVTNGGSSVLLYARLLV